MIRRLVRFARSMLAAVFFLAFGIGGLAIGFVCFPVLAFVSRRSMRSLVRASYRLFVWAARVTGLFRVIVSPADRIALSGTRGHVIVANHPTLIDIVILIALLPDTTAIAKASAGNNFFYSRIVRAVFLSNDDTATLLDESGRILREGVNIVVFPEGTRTPVDSSKRTIHRGAAHIALRAGVPLLPVSITCTPLVLAKGQPWYDVADRTITWEVRVGEPIPAASGDSHAAACRLTGEICDRLWP